VSGRSDTGYDYGESGYAGFLVGNVRITDFLQETGGSSKIDHLLDPASKYLSHSWRPSFRLLVPPTINNARTILDK
jgi:hypothetical protein